MALGASERFPRARSSRRGGPGLQIVRAFDDARRMGSRKGFTKEQEAAALQRQKWICPCCRRSLKRLDHDAHHRDGDHSNNSSRNLVMVCERCHHLCYHDQQGISRKPTNCRAIKRSPNVPTGRLCACSGCAACTTRYRSCSTEIARPRARICSYCMDAALPSR